MKLNLLLVINAIIAAVFGLAFILVPAWFLNLYGITLDPSLKYIGWLLGTALLGDGVISWYARNAGASEAGRAIVAGFFVCHISSFIAALIGQLGGVVNWLGWSTVAVYLLIAVGFGAFLIKRPATE